MAVAPRRGAAGRRWFVPCVPQRWLCRAPLGGVGVVRCVSPTTAPWTSHPRARLVRALLVPKVALACPIGRGSRSLVVARPRPSASRLVRTTPRDGGDAGGDAAQNRARRFSCPTRLAEKTAALGFPPPAGVAPLSNEVGTTPRTIHRNTGGSCASRGLRLFSRRLGLNEDAAGTLRAGRENRSPVIGGASGHFKHEGGRRARRGRCLGRGKNNAGSGDSLEIVHLFSKRIGDAWREASRRIAVGESRRSNAVGSFESSERGRSERHRGRSRQGRGRKAGSAAKRELSAALSSRSAALSDRSAAENETEGRTSSLKTGERGSLGGWGDLALRGNAGKAQQAQAKRGWGGAGRAARRIGAALCRDRGREGVKMRQKVGPQVSKAGIAAKRGRGRGTWARPGSRGA